MSQNSVNIMILLRELETIDLDKADAEGKIVIIDDAEFNPKYLMYLVEYLTGQKYSVWKRIHYKG